MLLKIGANPNEVDEVNGNTGLFYAAASNSIALARYGEAYWFINWFPHLHFRLFLKRGVDVSARNRAGETALFVCARLNLWHITLFLLLVRF